MSDLEQIVNGEQPVPEPAPEAVVEPVTPEPTPEPEPTPTAEPKREAEPHMVPVGVVSELRQSNRELQQRLEQLTQALTPRPEAPKMPDVLENPQGFEEHLQTQFRVMTANFQADLSESNARAKHGDEVVNAAFEAAKATGQVANFAGGKDPWGRLVQWHKGEQVRQEIGDDPAAYRSKLEAELRATIQAEMVAEQAKAKAAQAAPSMANVTGSTGGAMPTWAGPTPLDEAVKN
ncbi:MAG: hypothetical protein HRT81_17530 [Henriciella sp.]|nr:hypothetical protein [Henriciella sp.]